MSWQKMLFVTGLMTLLALTHAGGDHIKGGHGEDRDHIKGGSEAVDVQEGILPLPYSFDIKTGTPYGTRVSREEIGDPDGTVKGFYTIDSPRGTKRIVEYRADDSGFHANIKTSEPNIKSHNPSNVVIESISKTGSSSNLPPQTQVIRDFGKANDGVGLHHAAALPVLPILNLGAAGSDKSVTKGGVKTIITQGTEQGIPGGFRIREPVAFPVFTSPIGGPLTVPIVNQPQNVGSNPSFRRKYIKTIRRKVIVPKQTVVGGSSGRQEISKTRVGTPEEQTEALPDSKRVAPAPQPVRPDNAVKDSQKVLGNVPYITIDGGYNDAGKEVIVLEDGSIVEAADVSRSLGKVPESVEQSKSLNANQDIRYFRGPQVPLKDVSLNSKDQTSDQAGQTRKITPDKKLTVIKQGLQPVVRTSSIQTSTRNAGFRDGELGGSVIVPGGPGGAPISLTQDEIQNILSSGGVIEFPDNRAIGSFDGKDILPSQKQSFTPASLGGVTTTQIKKQTIAETTSSGKPATRISPSLNRKNIELKSQTPFISAPYGAQIPIPGVSTGPILVPGGPRGASLSLTEGEIQNILSSGGVVDFPSDSSIGSIGAKDVLISQRQPSLIGYTKPKLNIQTITQTSNVRKSVTRITPTLDRKTGLNIQTSTLYGPVGVQTQEPVISRGPIIVPGGPGGASLSLTQDEIQNILSSGGVVDFPSNPSVGYFEGKDVLTSQEKPSVVPGTVTATRTNVQSITQTSRARKPATRITPVFDRKTQTYYRSGPIGAQLLRPGLSKGPIIVPGGPGGASLSLTEAEIQSILSSGGVLDFPTNPLQGNLGARGVLIPQNRPSTVPGAVTSTRSNVQSIVQTSNVRKPATRIASAFDGKSQTSLNFGQNTAQKPIPNVSTGPIIVPGGPGGASLSLSQGEIQNILSSGGVVDFPSDSSVGYFGAKDVLISPVKPSAIPGAITATRTNVQSVTQTSSVRNPATRITPAFDRTDLRSQTYYRSGPIGTQFLRPELSRGPIVVPGGPGGSSLSLTEAEIQSILSSGGVLDFPSNPSLGNFGVRDVLISQNKPSKASGTITSTRSNVQSIDQISNVRKPATRISPVLDRKNIDLKRQTSFNIGPNNVGKPISRVSTGPVLVPGGPGGASLSLTEGEIQNILSSGGVVDFPSDSSVGSAGVRDILISQRQSPLTPGYTKPKLNVQSITQTSSARKPARVITPSLVRNIDFKTQTYTRSRPIGAQIVKPELSRGPISIPGGPGGASLSLTEAEIQNILSSGGVIDFPSDSNAGSFGVRDILIPERKSAISQVDSKSAAKKLEITSSVQPQPLEVNKNILTSVNSQRTSQPGLFSTSQINRGSSDITFNQGSVLRPNSNQIRKELIRKQTDPLVTQEHIENVFQPAEQSPHGYDPSIGTDGSHEQKHIQVEDISESKLPQTKVVNEIDPEQTIVDDNSSKYLQGSTPFVNPNYYPPSSFMAPFNYQAPQINVLRANYLPFKQEQQKLEQILI